MVVSCHLEGEWLFLGHPPASGWLKCRLRPWRCSCHQEAPAHTVPALCILAGTCIKMVMNERSAAVQVHASNNQRSSAHQLRGVRPCPRPQLSHNQTPHAWQQIVIAVYRSKQLKHRCWHAFYYSNNFIKNITLPANVQIGIPDVAAADLPLRPGLLSMCAGNFLEVLCLLSCSRRCEQHLIQKDVESFWQNSGKLWESHKHYMNCAPGVWRRECRRAV